MRILVKLCVATAAGTATMALILGMLESEVNWRRMLFIGAVCGFGGGAALQMVDHRRKLTPTEAVTLQLARTDLPVADAVILTEHLATLQAQQGDMAGTHRTRHHAPNG